MAAFGVIGTGVMGRSLALNLLDHDVSVAAWNLERDLLDAAVSESDGRLEAADSLEDLVARLEQPRRILMMITAGRPVDIVMQQLAPLLADGDIVIDGGNSQYTDTQRREEAWAERGLHFVGMGVSGGEEGARHGPSLMPGGSEHAYAHLAPVLERIAAVSDSGPCVTHCGPDGAGHFVKTVHNGIEYADMQAIAETYDMLHRVGGFDNAQLAATFGQWNQGPLESFLVELTAEIFAREDDDGEGYLVDRVLDKAEQKGTGRWTAATALELGISIPSIAAAVDARVLSSIKAVREHTATVFTPPTPPSVPADLASDMHDALFTTKVMSYAQGLRLIIRASEVNDWSVNLKEIARIWKAGCIIRARFLDTIMTAYEARPDLFNLILDDAVTDILKDTVPALRRMVALAATAGVPTPAMNASLAYFDSLRTSRLPQNLTQAQRDAFGAHGYRTVDDPDGESVHSDW
ncbi:MAG: NADP-dependent phosphogluconate dehydrogenase [Pseudomonadota bacterium]